MNKTGFSRAYLISVSNLGILGTVLLGLKGLLFALVLYIPISGMAVALAGACGKLTRKLFLGSKPNWSIKERFSADLSSARVQKMNGNYEKALLIIENVLSQSPDYSEALFVKAQILLDGFSDINRAKKYLRELLNMNQRIPLYTVGQNIQKFKLKKINRSNDHIR